MTAHRCAGGLKKKFDLRSGSQRHRHSGFFNVTVQAPTRDQPFLYGDSDTPPQLISFYDTLGIQRTHSRLNPRALTGVLSISKNQATEQRVLLYPCKLSLGVNRKHHVRLFTSCPGHNFVTTFPIWIFPTIVVHDPRVGHDLDPRSYLQGQGNNAHIHKIRVQTITPHCQVGSGYHFTQLLSMTQWRVMTLVQGHISKVKVTVLTYLKSVSGL